MDFQNDDPFFNTGWNTPWSPSSLSPSPPPTTVLPPPPPPPPQPERFELGRKKTVAGDAGKHLKVHQHDVVVGVGQSLEQRRKELVDVDHHLFGELVEAAARRAQRAR